jgi:hypothetical protein
MNQKSSDPESDGAREFLPVISIHPERIHACHYGLHTDVAPTPHPRVAGEHNVPVPTPIYLAMPKRRQSRYNLGPVEAVSLPLSAVVDHWSHRFPFRLARLDK